MQIPSFQPFQPPVRPTKPATAGGVAKPRENAPADSSRNTAGSSAIADDSFTASSYEPIQQAMNNLPDSRADVVARGQALIADPTYPGLSIITKLATLFVADAQASLVGDN